MGDTAINCLLCGKDMKPAYEVRGYWLYTCPNCSFKMIGCHTEAAINYSYDSTYFQNSKYKDLIALSKEHERRRKLLLQYAKGCIDLLDYGCASGEFVDYIRNDYNSWGCDISKDAISIAKDKYPLNSKRYYTIEDIVKLGVKFDVVCVWDVIEHIENPELLMKNLDILLKDKGVVLLSTPNIGSLFARITKTRWPFMTPPEHLCFYSDKSMSYLAKKYYYEIKAWKTWGKWANVGFIMYKFNRVSSIKIPSVLLEKFRRGALSRLRLYVPTRDVQYVVMKKLR